MIVVFACDLPGNLLGTHASKGKERLWRICLKLFYTELHLSLWNDAKGTGEYDA